MKRSEEEEKEVISKSQLFFFQAFSRKENLQLTEEEKEDVTRSSLKYAYFLFSSTFRRDSSTKKLL